MKNMQMLLIVGLAALLPLQGARAIGTVIPSMYKKNKQARSAREVEARLDEEDGLAEDHYRDFGPVARQFHADGTIDNPGVASYKEIARSYMQLVRDGRELRKAVRDRSWGFYARINFCAVRFTPMSIDAATQVTAFATSAAKGDERLLAIQDSINAQFQLIQDYCSQSVNSLSKQVPGLAEAHAAIAEIEMEAEDGVTRVLHLGVDPVTIAESRDAQARETRVRIIPKEEPRHQTVPAN